MKLVRPFREFHPAMKAAIFMLPVTLTVFLHNFFLKQPPDLRVLLRDYYVYSLNSLPKVFDFVVLIPIREELATRGPAWVLLWIIIWAARKFPDKKNFLTIGYITVWLFLIISTAQWAFGGHHYPITVFGYGLVWSWLMIRTKNILYPILFHAGSNGIAFLGIWTGFHLIY